MEGLNLMSIFIVFKLKLIKALDISQIIGYTRSGWRRNPFALFIN